MKLALFTLISALLSFPSAEDRAVQFRVFQIQREVDRGGRALNGPREIYLQSSEELNQRRWNNQKLEVYRILPLPAPPVEAVDDTALPEEDQLQEETPPVRLPIGKLQITSVHGKIIHARVLSDDLADRKRRARRGSDVKVVMVGDYASLIPEKVIVEKTVKKRTKKAKQSPFRRKTMRWKF